MERGGGERLSFDEQAEVAPISAETASSEPTEDRSFEPLKPSRELGPAPAPATPQAAAEEKELQAFEASNDFTFEDLKRSVSPDELGQFEDRITAHMEGE